MIVRLFQFCMGLLVGEKGKDKFKVKGVWFSLNFPERARSDHSFVQRGFSLVTFGAPAEGNIRLPGQRNLPVPHALAPYAVRSTVGVGCAIEVVRNRQHLPHKQFQKIPLAPAAVHTPPHPQLCSSRASSLLIETMFISTTHPNSCRERIRMAGLQSLLIPHMLLWRAHHTRMAKQKNLSILHAMLPVSLSEGKCSRKLCLPQRVAFMCRAQHLLRRAHSIARVAKFVSSARDTDSHFLRKHMLPHFLLAEPAFYPSCAHRTAFLPALPHFYVPVKGAGFAHPNDGTVKFAISARGAGGYFFRE